MSHALLTRSLLRFRRDRRGGIAVMAAVAALPLCVMSMAAYEYHQVVTVRTLLQDGIDAATLAAGRSGKKRDADLKAVGLPVLQARLSRSAAAASLQPADVTFTNVKGRITGVASVCVKPLIGYAVGLPQVCPSASSEVQREGTLLEVVLVLDNSGSMSEPLGTTTKIASLETATAGFVAKLEALDDPAVADDVRIGVVPFAGVVRTSSADFGAPRNAIIDEAGASSVNSQVDGVADPLFHSVAQVMAGQPSGVANPRRLDYFAAMGIAWAGCIESRPGGWGVTDAAPSPLQPDSLFVPYFAPDEADQDLAATAGGLGPPVQPFAYPNDYLNDGMSGFGMNPDQRAALYGAYWKQLAYLTEKYVAANPVKPAFTAAVANGSRGPNRGCVVRPVTPLSDDFTSLRTALTAMPLAGDTNIPLGLMWGWHVLSPRLPYADGKAYTARNVRKILVLMTDGDNSLPTYTPPDALGNGNRHGSSYSPYGYIWRGDLGLTPAAGNSSPMRTALDNRMSTICTNMKAAGVTVFTIQFAQGSTNKSNLVRCADPAGFYNAVAARQLDDAFQSIAEAISDLRVAR